MDMVDYRTIKFHYFSDRRITSLLIKWWLKDSYQHTGLELDDGSYVDSTFKHDGVKFRGLDSMPAKTDIMIVHKDVYDKLLEFINKADGKVKYDVKAALIGFGVGTKTQDDIKLFCSEFTEVCFTIATGIKIDKGSLTTPEDMAIATSIYASTVGV